MRGRSARGGGRWKRLAPHCGESHHQQNLSPSIPHLSRVTVDRSGLCSLSVRGGGRCGKESARGLNNAGRGRQPLADSALQTVWPAVCAGLQGWPVLERMMPGREEEVGLWRILPGFLREGLLGQPLTKCRHC